MGAGPSDIDVWTHTALSPTSASSLFYWWHIGSYDLCDSDAPEPVTKFVKDRSFSGRGSTSSSFLETASMDSHDRVLRPVHLLSPMRAKCLPQVSHHCWTAYDAMVPLVHCMMLVKFD